MTETWEPGIVFMEWVEVGAITLTQHRCWNASIFKEARRAEANVKTEKGKPTAVRFLSEQDFRAKSGR